MKAKVRKIVAWSVIAILPLAVLWVAIVSRPADKYQFLKPGRLVWRAYTMGGSHSAKEYRSYTWKRPWKEVVAAASMELEPLGLRREARAPKSTEESAVWSLNKKREGRPSFEGYDYDLLVTIRPGRSAPRASYIRAEADKDPEWVTVWITERAEQTWLHVIRAALFDFEDYP